MKAAYIEKLGPPENIQFGDLPKPAMGASQVLVKVAAVAVNPIDTYIRRGAYSTRTDFPFIIGRDMVGRVEAVGGNSDGWLTKWLTNQGENKVKNTFTKVLNRP